MSWASSYHPRARSGRRVSLLVTWFVHGLSIPLAHLVAAVVNSSSSSLTVHCKGFTRTLFGCTARKAPFLSPSWPLLSPSGLFLICDQMTHGTQQQ